VLAQAVPAHIGEEDPEHYASFLPPLFPESVAADIRAVVFVTQGAEKGTPRSAQEYVAPLLVLSGREYAAVPFRVLHERLCEVLRGDRPRLAAEVLRPDGSSSLVYDDGSVVDGTEKPRTH
jgi:hypothetical protein